MSLRNITVAVSAEFFNAFAQIPKRQQTKVLNFVNKFRTDPTSLGINYESIKAAKDKNLKSVRIDKSYRGIVMKPDNGNVYLLLWVDLHDDAYDWARRRICNINPETGCIQVYQVTESIQNEAGQQDEAGLFGSVQDRHLVRLGVPKDQLRLVRSIASVAQLEACKDLLPLDCYEALVFLAEGDSLDDVLMLIDSYKEELESVDVGDYAKALNNSISRQKFFVDPSEKELEGMLYAPLEKWRVFLHPSQRKIVERDWNGPVRLLGGAGTGKTVVALHRAKWLAENRCPNGKKILLTTFTRNLAADIESNLKAICSSELMQKIVVVNLDKWVGDFLKKRDYNFTIDYGNKTGLLWDLALEVLPNATPSKFNKSFFKEEWESIIQPNEVLCLKDYFKVSRVGRGIRLGRKERKMIWPVFEEFRVLLNEKKFREPADAMREVRNMILQDEKRPFEYVIVDEAQDMSRQAFLLLRAMVAEGCNDLFVTGDAHQRIYGQRVVLGHCGINIRGRAKKLRINYRTTGEIKNWAVRLMEKSVIDDLDGGSDNNKQYSSLLHGEDPKIERYDCIEDESASLTNFIKYFETEAIDLNSICVVARTNFLVDQYYNLLKEKGIPVYRVRRTECDDRSQVGVRLATMHRVKGLEFEAVLIAGVNDRSIPYFSYDSKDLTVLENMEKKERALLYVAATRAKKYLVVTGFGKQSLFVVGNQN